MSVHEPEEQKTTRPTQSTKESARSKRTKGEDPAPAPGHLKGDLPRDYREINGWGADLDPANRPAWPKELPSTVMTARGDVKDWQEPRHKIHVSNEHPDLTPVFGESCPPHGLSGILRDYAFQFGEATNRHWMTLMLADRVDVIEHLISDALKGQPDRYLQEKAWGAKIRYADEDVRRQYMRIAGAAIGLLAIGIGLNTLFSDSRR